MKLSPKKNDAQTLANTKGYQFNKSGKMENPDTIHVTKSGRMAHATKCPLGEGQNASIFLAQNLDNAEFLAVKIYDKSRIKESYHVENQGQIEIEQKVLEILGMNKGLHKVDGNTLHVYMPYIEGVDIEKAKASEIGDFTDALHYAQLATQTLLKLHSNNFIHADLHAGNIMICPKNKSLHFVDFEKCMYMDKDSKELEIWGKPSFLPQRAYDKARPKNGIGGEPLMVSVNKEMDKYGLGIALYSLFSKVLGKDALSIDNNGHIQIKNIPEGISEADLKELVKILHNLTLPSDQYLTDIAKAFESLKQKFGIQDNAPITYLPSVKHKPKPSVSTTEQIIGTQAFGALYHFSNDDVVVEQAKRIAEMGSTMIKFSVDGSNNYGNLSKISAIPFNKFFIWWRSGSKKCHLTQTDLKAEYDATYAFTKKLLVDNANLERTFYLGHWEGDWYLLPDYDASKNPSPERVQGMIDWLNIRQKAVEAARKDFGAKSLSKVYHYTEVNRVQDAKDKNMDRLVNKVLPQTNVDYVSYSSYDVQEASQETINETIKYIESNLNKKHDINGPRVFIGECGVPAKNVGDDPVKHEQRNREIMRKFLKSGVPYILYWQMYNNELVDKNQPHGKQVGFWLIDNKDQKQPLYHTLESLYKAQPNFNNIREDSIRWLDNNKCQIDCSNKKAIRY